MLCVFSVYLFAKLFEHPSYLYISFFSDDDLVQIGLLCNQDDAPAVMDVLKKDFKQIQSIESYSLDKVSNDWKYQNFGLIEMSWFHLKI